LSATALVFAVAGAADADIKVLNKRCSTALATHRATVMGSGVSFDFAAPKTWSFGS